MNDIREKQHLADLNNKETEEKIPTEIQNFAREIAETATSTWAYIYNIAKDGGDYSRRLNDTELKQLKTALEQLDCRVSEVIPYLVRKDSE